MLVKAGESAWRVGSRRWRIRRLGYDYQAQTFEQVTSCNLCAGQRFAEIARRDRYGYPVRAVACLRCGLVFLAPRMTDDAYARFYQETYRPLLTAYKGREISPTSIQEGQRLYARDKANLLAEFLKPRADQQATLLDIGGSTGVVAAHLADAFDLQATVLDPAPAEIDVARARGIETATGFAEGYGLRAPQFTLITVCRTVDHLLDIRATLERIREWLHDSGVLFIDILDFYALCRRSTSVQRAVKIDHPYYLTREAMTAYLLRAGFQILKIDRGLRDAGFICTKAEPDTEALPDADSVSQLLREIRRMRGGARA